MSNDIDGIDRQIERLQDYRKNGKSAGTPTSDQLAIEQALASAYVAKTLQSINQFLDGLTVLKESLAPVKEFRLCARLSPDLDALKVAFSLTSQRALGWWRSASGSGNHLDPVLEERQSGISRRSLC
jgi:hypothetical protein